MSVIQMIDGTYIDLVNPDFSDLDIKSIAWSLSMICRFNGHTSTFYSVAQHSVLASVMVPHELAFDALMHDSAEAILGDVVSPLKSLLRDYKEIEKRIEEKLFSHFNVNHSDKIKEIDLILLATERDLLMPETGEVWPQIKDVEPSNILIKQGIWSQEESYNLFLEQYNKLKR